ncbi:PC4 and SFRS1-interacting protein isoform X2 [Diachasma alloeum]|uniref:PC4 and SFRS1-interacting protein isoform X2 n=1 Tax=Diachasma alloeum TaxID=454923 RepID=UPI0007383251|nr:PC4 and SFRS1-interacting protein isoform X2 [Diachasma alloeum]
MKLLKKYLPGDKVFAKVRGYPPWPARVEGVTDPNTKNAKYKVFFYGTGETAVCKVEELFLYEENKEKYGKHLKRKIFHEGLQQLERELNNEQGKPETVTPKKAVVETSEKETRPTPEVPPSAGLDSDLETGPLVIDEGDKKKQLKRKSLATPINSQDSPEPKKKRGRAKGWYTADNTPKPETNDSLIEDSSKEVVSRSGRKIKPKRFADFSSSDEFDMENFARGRGRSKVDDSLEAPPIPSIPKKRVSLDSDKKEDKKASPKEENPSEQKSKLKWLRMENQLLQLDAQIKSNLGLDRANTDECLEAMEEMLGLSIEPLMLKKHPHVVETVKRLRRYIGNVAEWKFTEDQVLSFKQKSEVIRQKAEHIYNKFKALFVVPDAQSFWQAFSDQVEEFKTATKDMKEEKVFALMVDPTLTESQEQQSHPSNDKITDAMMDVDKDTSTTTYTMPK